MPIVNLDIPVVIQGTKQSVEYNPKILQLNEGYQQITGSSEHTTTWTLVSALTEYTTIDGWTDFLDSFDASVAFSISLGDEIGRIIIYCDSYTINYTTASKGTLTMECTESSNNEYLDLKDLLSIDTIPTSIYRSTDFLLRYSAANYTNTDYRYLGVNVSLPSRYLHLNESIHYGDPTGNTSDIQINGKQQSFPDVANTTENACLHILALTEAIPVQNFFNSANSGSLSFLTEQIAASLRTFVFKAPVPDPYDSYPYYLPNSIFTIRGSVTTKSLPTSTPKFNENPNNSSTFGLWDSVTFTQIGSSTTWVANLPTNLNYVYRVISFSGSGGQTETKKVTTKVISGSELSIQYWRDFENKKCYYYGSRKLLERLSVSGDSPGQLFITAPSGFNGQARVIYSINSGTISSLNIFKLYPFLQANDDNEIIAELSNFSYLYKAFKVVAESTNNPYYGRIRDAIRNSIEKITQLNTLTQISTAYNFTTDPVQNVLDIPGINLIHNGGRAGVLSFDSQTNYLTVVQSSQDSGTSGTSLVLQFTNKKIVFDEFTVFKVNVYSNLNSIFYNQFLEIKFDTNKNGQILVYKIAIPIPNGAYNSYSITYKDLVNWGSTSYWYPTHQNDPFYLAPANATGSTQSIFFEQQAYTDSFGNSTTPIVCRIMYHRTSAEAANPSLYAKYVHLQGRSSIGNFGYGLARVLFKLKTGKMKLTYWQKPFTDQQNKGYDLILYPDATDNWRMTTFEIVDLAPRVSGDVFNPAFPVTFITFELMENNDAELTLYSIGDEPKALSIPWETTKVYFENKSQYGHTWAVKWDAARYSSGVNTNYTDIQPNNYAFVPGIVPKRAVLKNNNFIKFDGVVTIAGQTHNIYQQWGKTQNCKNIEEFLRQSSEAYKNTSSVQQKGLFKPLFSLGLPDTDSVGEGLNQFFDIPNSDLKDFPEITIGADPYGMLQYYKLIFDLSESWINDPNNNTLADLVMNFISAINDYWRQQARTDYIPTFLAPANETQSLYYFLEHSPESYAILLMAALNANIAGGSRLMTFKTIYNCIKYLRTQEVGGSENLYGSWTYGAPTISINGTTYKRYRTETHAWCIRSYCKLYRDQDKINYPNYQEWILS